MESSVRRRKVEKQKPDRPRDRLLGEVLDMIEGMSAAEVSRVSGNVVGASTICSWRKGKVARPQCYTMNAALSAIGKELAIRTIRRQ